MINFNIRFESFNDRYLVSFEKKGKSNNRNLIRNKRSSDMFILEQYSNWNTIKMEELIWSRIVLSLIFFYETKNKPRYR